MQGSEPGQQIRLEYRSPAYWCVTFDVPPLNIFDPWHMTPLGVIVSVLGADSDVWGVVFDGTIDGFFLAHCDFLARPEDTFCLLPGPTGLRQLRLTHWYGSAAPSFVSIAKTLGRATFVGSELSLASDMRSGSRENGTLSLWEVGCGLVPGAGAMVRLRRLTGRGRALEVLLGADEVRRDVAELYGDVNRAPPDGELDGFVDALAARLASFDKRAILDTKRLANQADPPLDAGIQPEWDTFLALLIGPGTQARIKLLMDKGFHMLGDVETRLSYHIGQIGL
ncbi:MAG: enoyl-CoA hydratase/isomerase family protein [Proteobacteria bacterium]|nr:enoyl-CoA hydratase/isomerase family protein [Pseudomonadota bacterium]